MGGVKSPFIEGLVSKEIRRLVAEAIERGETISTSETVQKVRAIYPRCGVSKRAIADEVVIAAEAAGAPVAIGVVENAPGPERWASPESA